MSSRVLPPCGLYRTVAPIGEVAPANRAHFSPQGTTLPIMFDPSALLALPAEGFYRVTTAFFCCEKRCVQFDPDAFVQLGYNGAGRALLFVPEFAVDAITIPERGTPISDAALGHLVALRVSERREQISLPRGILVH